MQYTVWDCMHIHTTHKTTCVTHENTYACKIFKNYFGRRYAEFMRAVVSEERVENGAAFGEQRRIQH